LVFVVDVARAFDAYIVLANAAREGARFATLEPSPTEAGIKQLVVVDVVGSGTNITHMADFSPSDVSVDLGTQAVTVTVTYDFNLWFGGLVGVPTFPLHRESVMPIFEPEEEG
jgi:Flp pilus assembly protein TadG